MYLVCSIGPESDSMGAVSSQLSLIAAALDPVQNLQAAEKNPTVQGPVHNRHLHNREQTFLDAYTISACCINRDPTA